MLKTRFLVIYYILAILIVVVAPINADSTITVNTFSTAINPDGLCSLQEAVANANDNAQTYTDCVGGSGTDTINLPSGIYTLNNDDLELTDSTIINGAAMTNTFIQSATSLASATNRVLTLNTASMVVEINDLTIQNGRCDGSCAITNNVGGGIFANSVTLTMTNTVITTNFATVRGGGIYSENSTLTLNNIDLTNNSADFGVNRVGRGGGIYNFDSTLTIENTSLLDTNYSDGDGAVIFARGANSDITITNTTISNNTSDNRGGAIFNEYDSFIHITNTAITDNTANGGGGGGAIYNGYSSTFNDGGGDITIDGNSVISGNDAPNGSGGGIYFSQGTLNASDTVIQDNSAIGPGGGIGLNTNAIATLTNVTVGGDSTLNEHNTSAQEGGGLSIRNNSRATISNSIFSGNYAPKGGGIYAESNITFLNMTDSIIGGTSLGEGNTASRGAGIYIVNTGVTTDNTLIAYNQATIQGGGAYGGLHGTNVTISNNSVSGTNTNDGGGAVYLDTGQLNLQYATVVENMAGNIARSGLWVTNTRPLTLLNTIFAHNGSGTNNCALDSFNNNIQQRNFDNGSTCTPFSDKNATINLDVLQDNGGFSATHDLLSGSTPIEGATGTCPSTDQRGVSRPIGTSCDAGAVEVDLVNVELHSGRTIYNSLFVSDVDVTDTWHIWIRDMGCCAYSGTATSVVVEIDFPTGVTVGNILDIPVGTFDGQFWIIDELTFANYVNRMAELSFEVIIDDTVPINTYLPVSTTIAMDQINVGWADFSTSIFLRGADLELMKTVDNLILNEGDTIQFDVTVNNLGITGYGEPPAISEDIQVQDVLPSGLTYVTATSSDGFADSSFDTNTNIWTINTLDESASMTLSITATVDAGTGGTVIDNTATIIDTLVKDPNDTNDADTVSIDVQLADIAIDKTIDLPQANEGDTVTFTVTATNNGPDPASNIVIADMLPTGLTFSTATGDGSYNDTTGEWLVSSLAASNTATLYLSATVDEGTATTILTNTAAISSVDQADHTNGNDSDNAEVYVLAADLDLVKVADKATAAEGDTVTFTLTLTNNGPDTATNIVIDDLLPAGLTFSGAVGDGSYNDTMGEWSLSSLAVSSSATIDISATVDADTAGNTLTNNAAVGDVDQADTDNGNNADGASVYIPAADLSITKIVSNESPIEGEAITFTVTLTNHGPDAASNISVSDVVPAGLTAVQVTPTTGSYNAGTWTVSALANSASTTLTVSGTVESGMAGNDITNTASITSALPDDPDDNNNNDSATASVIFASDIAVTKDVDLPQANEGDTVTFTITATNLGPNAATNISLVDTLPAGLTFANATGDGDYSSLTDIWSLTALNPSSSATLYLSATVDAGTATTTLTNTATFNSIDQYEYNSANDSDSASVYVLAAELDLDKVGDKATAAEGDTVTFTLTLTNNGPDTATNIVIDDLLPAGLTFSGAVGDGSYNDTTGEWSLSSLAVSSSAAIDISATVDAGTAGNTLTNNATVGSVDQADTDNGNNTDSASVYIPAADLSITKIVNNESPIEGETITFTVTLTNHGPDAASNISVSDVVPAGLTAVQVTPNTGSYDAGTWTVSALANSAFTTLTVSGTVESGMAGNDITNTASITSALPDDPEANNNSDSATASVVYAADLGIAKDVDVSNPTEIDTVSFTLTLTNYGPNTANNIIVADALPMGLTFTEALGDGSYNETLGEWSIASLSDSNTASITISASVDDFTLGSVLTNTATITSVDELELNTANNSDSGTVTITGAPDLTGAGFDANPDHVRGGFTTVTLTVENIGTAGAGEFTAAIFLSDNINCSASDIWVGGYTFSNLAAQTSAQQAVNINIPRDQLYASAAVDDAAGMGVGYVSTSVEILCMIVDYPNAVIESEETNNANAAQGTDRDDITYFPWDTNGDGTVTPADAVHVVNRMGQTVDGNNAYTDINGDGNIDATDVSDIQARFGYSRNNNVIE